MRSEKSIITKLIIIDIILFVIVVFVYKFIFEVETMKRIYAEESVRTVEENKNPNFKIKQIMLYNNANLVDSSDGKLQDIAISQYTDIAITIDNTAKNKDLSYENTVNQLYINNIKITPTLKEGVRIFNYKNAKEFGKYVELNNCSEEGIVFDVVVSNEKNNIVDYNKNVFYTDCSNPITFGLINKDILKNGAVDSESGSISYDGSVLKKANIDLKSISSQISFTINLVNNYNEKYTCDVEIDNDLLQDSEELLTGYSVRYLNLNNKNVKFRRSKD